MKEGSETAWFTVRDDMRSFLEHFGLHLVIEVTVVSLIDRIVMNTAISMAVGIGLVEGARILWQKWRKTNWLRIK
jgi:hypothetical protein